MCPGLSGVGLLDLGSRRPLKEPCPCRSLTPNTADNCVPVEHHSYMGSTQLFSNGGPFKPGWGLSDVLQSTARAVSERLQSMNANALLNAPVQDVIDELVEAGSVRCPELDIDSAYQIEPTEVDQQYQQFGERYLRHVTRFVLVVPFDGEKDIFTFCPDHSTTVRPSVLQLNDDDIRLAVDDPPDDPAALKQGFDNQIATIEKYLAWSRSQIEAHNQQIVAEVPVLVMRRREQLLATRNLQASIGYPVQRRKDADTYATPLRRRTIKPSSTRPAHSNTPFKPEPTMAMDDYYEALRVLRSQRNALERNPSVAAKLDEEEIRNLLLIGLNAHFEGAAGGEVFNGAGKTDILIRVDDRNIFIGECKVWSGPRTMDSALDQLFRYLVWRDTKAAILLFIRNENVSAVIDKAIQKVREHPNHKRSKAYTQTDLDHYEFTMHTAGDPEREIHLTLVPFALGSAVRQAVSDG